MKKTTRSLFSIFILSAFVIVATGCGGGATDDGLGNLNPTPPAPPAGSGPLPGTSDGVVADNFFYVGVDSTVNTIAQVHTASSFSTACAVDKAATTSQDISCIIDIPEGDITQKGVAFKYHVPTDMCRYLGRSTYWYYSFETGTGPADIVIDATVSSTTTISYDCTVNGVANPGCVGEKEITVDPKTFTPTCVYDTTAQTDGKNCCFGDYNLQINVNDLSTGTLTTGSVQKLKWGGGLKNCLGGAVKLGWDAFAKTSEVPLTKIENADAGLTDTYKVDITSISTQETLTDFFVANYYDPAIHTHTGFVNVGPSHTTNKPYFVDPIDDRSGTLMPSGNDAYTFTCLDAAFEVKHRIKVYVRDWDTYPDYLNFISSAGATVIPDRGAGNAQEGTDCSGVGTACDDFYDLDDFLKLHLGLGAYDTSPGNVGHRIDYFPFEVYSN